ncbi:hypothetical protein MASR1M65_31800 [Saprospiraceae bacterium]
MSDLYVNTNYRIGEKSRLALGVKIPLSDGNVKENEKSLPMDYQPSLGTYDLILGATTSLIGIQPGCCGSISAYTEQKRVFFCSISYRYVT